MQNGFFLYEDQQVRNDSSHPHPHPQEIRLVYTVKKIDFFPNPQKASESVEMSKEMKTNSTEPKKVLPLGTRAEPSLRNLLKFRAEPKKAS